MSDLRLPSRPHWILMALLTLGALAMMVAVRWYYVRQRAAVEANAVHELTAVAGIKAAQIENWRAERIGDGRVIASSPLMRNVRRILSAGTVTEADRAEFMAVFNALEHEFLYTGAALVDREGRVRIGSHVTADESPRLSAFATAAQRAGGVILTDLYRDAYGSVHMAVAIPAADASAIILRIDASRFLYPYLESWPTATRTAETFLARRDGEYMAYLSELRQSPGSALNLRRRIPVAVPDDRQLEAGWFVKSTDYRGVPTMSIVRRVRGSDWYLLAKIDDDEVYAPLTRLAWELTLVVGLIALTVSAGVGYMWRNQQLQAYRERKALQGHFDSLTRYANDIILLLDDSGRIIEANQRAAQAYGYTEQEFQSLAIQALEAAAPGDRPTVPATDEGAGVRYETVHRRKDGTSFPVEVSSRLIEVDGTKFQQSILRDIGERVRTEQQIKALNARLIDAQEEERARLARDLHDDLSQQVAALSIGMSNLKRQLPADQAEAREQSGRIQQRLVQVSESIRQLSHQLHPAVLDHSGLGAAIRGLCSEFGLLTKIRVSCRIGGAFEGVPPAVSLCIYRITQESLRNISKHARVSEAEVELNCAEGVLSLTVSDRGAGMDLKGGGAPAGLGLVSMKERVRLVNGKFEIRSQPNQGTTLSVRIPV